MSSSISFVRGSLQIEACVPASDPVLFFPGVIFATAPELSGAWKPPETLTGFGYALVMLCLSRERHFYVGALLNCGESGKRTG